MTTTASRERDRSRLYKLTMALATGAVGFQGDEIENIRGTNTVGPAGASSNAYSLGTACESYSQTAGDTAVQVELHHPVDLEWFENGEEIAIATDFRSKCYFGDGATVVKTKASGGVNRAYAGIIWVVDAARGVGVQRAAAETADLLS